MNKEATNIKLLELEKKNNLIFNELEKKYNEINHIKDVDNLKKLYKNIIKLEKEKTKIEENWKILNIKLMKLEERKDIIFEELKKIYENNCHNNKKIIKLKKEWNKISKEIARLDNE